MVRILLIGAMGLLLPLQFGGCGGSGQGAWAPPGQVQKKTGFNPASGKYKGQPGKGYKK